MEFAKELQEKLDRYLERHKPTVDWNQNAELSHEQITRLIKSESDWGEVETEMEEINEIYMDDIKRYAVKEAYRYFKDDLIKALGPKEGWKKQFKQHLRDHIYVDIDLKTLAERTGDQVFFYDLGLYFNGYGNEESEYRLDRIRIKKAMGIESDKYDDMIWSMLMDASYGGRLVVYFMASVVDIRDAKFNYENNRITFKNPVIAIVDHEGGSGGDCTLEGHEVKMHFNPKNVFYDRSIKYNYTYEVCGMTSDWCDSTQWSVSHEDTPPEIKVKDSAIYAHLDEEERYNAAFRAGGCTLGDKDMNRHRNRIYVNQIPCGTHCLDCGQFWID